MKPKLFIGSSSESKRFATGIHSQLAKIAECTPWVTGFGADLSKSTLDGLMRNVRESDFGVFVFSADDVLTLRGTLFKATRDNVVYEAGLFTGYLGPERCLIAIPQDTRIHLPSDLSGITVGEYEDKRTDKDVAAAVNAFCDLVAQRIKDIGLFQGPPQQEFRDMIVRFECTEWVGDEDKRIRLKRMVYADIERFCKTNRLNKHRLLAQMNPGYNMALLCSIRLHPEPDDWTLIKEIRQSDLPPGFAYYKLMDAVEALKTTSNITPTQLQDLQSWLKALPGPNAEIAQRISALVL